MKRLLILAATHAAAVAFGFALGIYTLPILIAPPAPADADVQAVVDQAEFTATFRRDLAGSDALHWGEGTVSITSEAVALRGRIAPGPDYQLYLSPEFVETEDDFLRLKPRMVRLGGVDTFENFVVPVPPSVDPSDYAAVIVWCESFGQFITAARYKP